MKKVIGLGLAAVMIASLLVGCGGSSASSTVPTGAADQKTTPAASSSITGTSGEEGKKVTLTFMNHTSEQNTIDWEDSVINGFETAHPNVTIDVQRMSYDDYIQTLQTKFASGDAPDIFSLENTYVQKYLDNGYISDLNDTDAANSFNEGALDMLSINGKVYAIPYSASVMDVTYNKQVFEKCGITKVPTTLDEFYADCKKIKDAGITPIGAGYKDTWCLMADLQADYIAGILLKDNNAILDVQNRTKTFTGNEEWKGVLQRIKDRYQYVNSDAFGTDWDTVCTGIANGTIAMALNGNWTPNNVLAMDENANLGSFPMPTDNNAADTIYAVQSPTEGYALNASSQNLDIAKEFLNYYTSSESVNSFVNSISQICIVKGADTSKATGALKDIMDSIAAGGSKNLGAVDHNFTNEYRDAVQTVVSDFLLKNKGVDKALADLDKEFDRIASSSATK